MKILPDSKSFIMNLILIWFFVLLVMSSFVTFAMVAKPDEGIIYLLSGILAILTGLLLRRAIVGPFLAELRDISKEDYYAATKEMRKNNWKGYIVIVIGVVQFYSYFIYKFRLTLKTLDVKIDAPFVLVGFTFVTIGSIMQLRYLVRGILKRKNVIEQG